MDRKRLLILACSARKRPHPGPAVEVYDGPAYRVLRKALAAGIDDVVVYILSARHGLIPAWRWIAPYDQRMTPARAEALRSQVQQALAEIAREAFSEVYIEAGRVYHRVLPEDLAGLFRCQVRRGAGRIGRRCAALKAWLYGDGDGDGGDDDADAGVDVADLPPSLAALAGDDLACIAGDGQIDHGTYLHLLTYASDDLGIETPESLAWVEAAVAANPGIWTARLCRAMHDREETPHGIAHCGLCSQYANGRKRERARKLPPRTLPGFESVGGAYQLHRPCGRRGLTWLRKLVYRRREQGRWLARRERIPDSRQSRGWDWGTRIYVKQKEV